MSFSESKKLMEEGDTVLLYIRYDNYATIQLKKGHTHQNRFGALKHDCLIGEPYGVKVDCPKGWVFPLQPTPELWTLALPHRTQILYTPDISMIVFQLWLKPGSIVIEAGTGSGSLSHALIRTIMPTGRLHTFEFHADRCAAASKEFIEHGLSDYVTIKNQDVCSQGFGLTDEADALFLDLPAPWECVVFAKQALKSGGRLCSFSPCMEQVQRTSEMLRDHGFTDLSTVECLAHSFSVQNITLSKINFDDEEETVTERANSRVDSEKMAKCEERGDKAETVMDNGASDITGQGETGSKNQAPSTHHTQFPIKVRAFKTGTPPETMQGHTGFLTFASIF